MSLKALEIDIKGKETGRMGSRVKTLGTFYQENVSTGIPCVGKDTGSLGSRVITLGTHHHENVSIGIPSA